MNRTQPTISYTASLSVVATRISVSGKGWILTPGKPPLHDTKNSESLIPNQLWLRALFFDHNEMSELNGMAD